MNVDLWYDMIILMIDDDDSVDGNWCLQFFDNSYDKWLMIHGLWSRSNRLW